MNYAIKITDVAKAMMKGISDQRIINKIGERIDKLTADPELQGKKLKGIFSGYRCVRAVGQRYRVVYKADEQKVTVYVIGVGIRKEGSKGDVYLQLRKLLEKT